jgi:phosphoglycerate dehydrogenase-like enzyme
MYRTALALLAFVLPSCSAVERGTPREDPTGALALASTRGSVVAVPMAPGAPRPQLRFVTSGLGAEEVEELERAVPNVTITVVRDRDEALRYAAATDGIAAHLCTPALLRLAHRLRWVQAFSAGVERHLAIPELAGNDRIVLTNMKGMHGPAIADHVFAMLLSLARALPHYQEAAREHRWAREEEARQIELRGKVMLIVGLGGIGRQIAARAQAFGMRVWATAHEQSDVPGVERIAPPEQLAALLPEADVVAVSVPLTPETKGMFGAAQFAAMKQGACFINIARGQIVGSEALAAALASGHLAGAGLDVTDPEPLPPEHPLWSAPNVIITPHVAAQSAGTEARVDALFRENLRRFGAGEPLLNVVDKRAGY